MAENNQSSQSPVTTNSFSRGMQKDYNETFVADGLYTHARNSVNNSHDGQLGVIGNEPANLLCVTLPYTLIGSIHVFGDEWVLFTTDDVNSEIGIFDESKCSYKKIVNDKSLNFKKTNLITGVSRFRYDCERLIYWDDGLNPTRTMDIDNVPFKYTETIVDGCIVKTYTDELDCEAIRIAPLIKYPCLQLTQGKIAGSLLNGSYQVCLAYTVNKVKVTDYIGLSEVQGLFTYANAGSSLEVTITNIDTSFDEFELVVLANINQQTVAKRIGYYTAATGTIYIDRWTEEYETVQVSSVVLRSSIIEKSDAMYNVGEYLLRVGVTNRYKFNYQLQANNIRAKWLAVQYPADYYIKGNNNTSYLRDEQYAFFIRWIYNTGERSESYHIPGRAPLPGERTAVAGGDAFETSHGIPRELWQVQNTAAIESLATSTLPDGGVVIAKGRMGFWESTEKYPADRADIWGNLCGKPIRHHKMPDVTINGGDIINHFNNGGNNIVMLGVQFEGITHPLDQNGNPITSIVGYEILRGSREGAKSILCKGLLNNMREYSVPENPTITGLYQNYPYNDLRPDIYLTAAEQNGENGGGNPAPLNKYRRDVLSFHSPDTSFSNPYLNVNEVKIYQQLVGQSEGVFEVPYRHPKFKVASNFSSTLSDIVAAGVGVANVVSALAGGELSLQLSSTSDIPLTNSLLSQHRPEILTGTWLGVSSGQMGVTGAPIGDQLAADKRQTANTAITTANAALVIAFSAINYSVMSEQLYRVIVGFLPKKQYAAQYNSHGFYNNIISGVERNIISVTGNRRREITDANYIGTKLQQFTGNFQINNVDRSRYVALKLTSTLPDPVTIIDNSRVTLGSAGNKKIGDPIIGFNIASHYGALKYSIPSQYGQLESIKQLPISFCVMSTPGTKNLQLTSDILFGGDTYINRFTEKNSILFFNTWLINEPDGIEFNYTNYINLPYPRYWINTTLNNSAFINIASQSRSLDMLDSSTFYIKRGYFYLFNSGVRDFFVESEINLAYRDWEDEISMRHYDPYRFTDLTSMFRSDIIASGNFYKYDYSLSIAKLVNSSVTWGDLLPRDYNPIIDSTCYVYRPGRVIYSLTQKEESKKDSWRVFLPNNYYDFGNNVTSVKNINKTGALFMMPHQSPLSFMGVEELKLDGTGAKITIGDGGLFADDRQLQSIVNADESYEYGSNQNRFSAVGTSKGVFWVSQEQGKVFQYAGSLKEISNAGMKWWMAKYLPSQLLAVYPDYPLYDNPVIGVGVHTVYDNTNEILYICKKDYRPKLNNLTYNSQGQFFIGQTPVAFTNTEYFEDASWTISYDMKTDSWVSFHDWIPTFLLPGKNHFMTVKDKTIWKHNLRCDLFCNFYGKDYPWEIEYVSATGQQVNTMRSIEYLLEAYKYFNDCRDKFHVLDANFDHAVIHNSEQISGMLNLYLKSKTNPLDMLQYPKINIDSIDINFSKEENKYRFNQFWDVTKDRGEFSGAEIPLLNIAPDGYKRQVNPTGVNYNKPILQRKKFRHNVNRVWLMKKVSGENKFLFKISNQKLQASFR